MSAKTAAQHTTAELTWIGKDAELVFCSAKSSSQAGRINTVALDLVTGETHCDCKASEHGLLCWHRGLIAQRYVEEVARQYVATLATLADVEAVGRQARARIDACQGMWALVSPLDRAIYQAARVAGHERAAPAAPALALAA
ncbi:MAG: hypothetical protein ACTHMR_21560 [Thermomicrobiales bacterium]